MLVGLEGHPPPPGRRPPGCFFAPRCEFAIDLCTTTAPEPVAPASAGHWARCWRAEEIVKLPPLAELPERGRATETDNEPLLQVGRLSASYGERPVLSDVRFTVSARPRLAIVGESGAGKTTLARCIVGLHSNWRGAIMFKGTPLETDRRRRGRDVISRIQYIFQNPYTSLNPRKTAGQIVEQPLRELFSLPRRERARRAEAALEDAALSGEYARRYPHELSGGEGQRVAIARALVVEPEVLICDEITSALDVSVQATIVELLHRLQRTRGVTLLLVTHNLALVRSLADDVLIVRDGQIVKRGPSVLDQPKSE